MCSGNTEGVETVTDLYRTLQMRPEHDKERAAEAGDMDYVVSSTMRQMSQVPKDMSGEGAAAVRPFVLNVEGGKGHVILWSSVQRGVWGLELRVWWGDGQKYEDLGD